MTKRDNFSIRIGKGKDNDGQDWDVLAVYDHRKPAGHRWRVAFSGNAVWLSTGQAERFGDAITRASNRCIDLNSTHSRRR